MSTNSLPTHVACNGLSSQAVAALLKSSAYLSASQRSVDSPTVTYGGDALTVTEQQQVISIIWMVGVTVETSVLIQYPPTIELGLTRSSSTHLCSIAELSGARETSQLHLLDLDLATRGSFFFSLFWLEPQTIS